MGFFKCLAYVAGGVAAVALVPMTGGGSLAVAIGALGTTTAAGAAIGAGLGATAAAIDHASSSSDEAHRRGVAEGTKAGQRLAQQKYEAKMAAVTGRLRGYHDFEQKLVAMYAVGLAVANADGVICKQERADLDAFVSGCMAADLPVQVQTVIAKLAAAPPTLAQAIKFAKKAKLPKQDIDDIIDVVAHSDGVVNADEQAFIARWQAMGPAYESAMA